MPPQDLNNKNKVKVEIPKGSIKSTTTFTASEGNLEEGDIPKDKIGAFLFNGLVFNVEAVDTNGNAVREFSEDLTIQEKLKAQQQQKFLTEILSNASRQIILSQFILSK